MVLIRPRILTIMGLTSLLATMITVTRYSLLPPDNHPSPMRRLSPDVQQDYLKSHDNHRKFPKRTSSNSKTLRFGTHLKKSWTSKPAASDKDIVANFEKFSEKSSLSKSSHAFAPSSSSTSSPSSSSSSSSTSSSTSFLFPKRDQDKPLGLESEGPVNSNIKPGLQESESFSFPQNFSLPSSSVSGSISGSGSAGSALSSSSSSSSSASSSLSGSSAPASVAVSPSRAKITFDRQDLKSTEQFIVDKPLFCDADKGATIDLLVVVTSAVTHFDARASIRKTWGGFAVERGALVLFLLGSSLNESLQQDVYREEREFGDILQASFVDNYYNLTLKTISLMRWVSENCNQVKFVLKVDDDMFVNMQMVVDFSETRTFSRAIIGKLARKWRPHRNNKSKWFVPWSAFNGTSFPNFATGPAYIFTGDAVQPLLETSLKLTPLYLEDVYMTGIVAEKANVRRLNHALIKNVRLRVDVCSFRRFMTSHRHSPQEIIALWHLVYATPSKSCDQRLSKSKPTKKSKA